MRSFAGSAAPSWRVVGNCGAGTAAGRTEGGLGSLTRAPNDQRVINHGGPAELFHQHVDRPAAYWSPTRQWPSSWPERIYAASAHTPLGVAYSIVQRLSIGPWGRTAGDGRQETPFPIGNGSRGLGGESPTRERSPTNEKAPYSGLKGKESRSLAALGMKCAYDGAATSSRPTPSRLTPPSLPLPVPRSLFPVPALRFLPSPVSRLPCPVSPPLHHACSPAAPRTPPGRCPSPPSHP